VVTGERLRSLDGFRAKLVEVVVQNARRAGVDTWGCT
jgi:hypothetical protein